MELHRLWHVLILLTTLAAATGLALVALGPILFDPPPPARRRGRLAIAALAVVAALLLGVEWLFVHRRSL